MDEWTRPLEPLSGVRLFIAVTLATILLDQQIGPVNLVEIGPLKFPSVNVSLNLGLYVTMSLGFVPAPMFLWILIVVNQFLCQYTNAPDFHIRYHM